MRCSGREKKKRVTKIKQSKRIARPKLEEEITALSYIFSEGRRLEKMSAKLFELIYLNQNDIDKTRIQTENLIKEISDISKPILSKKQIILRSECEPAVICGNSELLISMFVNIIDNARKASESGGEVLLTGKILSRKILSEKLLSEKLLSDAVTESLNIVNNVQLENNSKNSYYQISITDYGIGMDKEEIDRICDEFYMSDKSRTRREGGAGLGMSLVKIIDRRNDDGLSLDELIRCPMKLEEFLNIEELKKVKFNKENEENKRNGTNDDNDFYEINGESELGEINQVNWKEVVDISIDDEFYNVLQICGERIYLYQYADGM